MSINPETWTSERVLKRFFPDYSGDLDSVSWQNWIAPRARELIPIDEFIKKLLLRSNPPRMRKKGGLPPHIPREGCPFFLMRRSIASAVHLATQRSNNDADLRTLATGRIEEYGNSAARLLDQLRPVAPAVERLGRSHLISGGLFVFDSLKKPTDRRDDRQLLEQIIALQNSVASLIPVLEEITKATEAARELWINNPPSIWKTVFVLFLSAAWTDLFEAHPDGTPIRPTNSPLFSEFIDSCWQSLFDGDPPEVSWDRTIRNVVLLSKAPA